MRGRLENTDAIPTASDSAPIYICLSQFNMVSSIYTAEYIEPAFFRSYFLKNLLTLFNLSETAGI